MPASVVLNSAHGALTSFTAAGGGKANFMINHTVVSNNNVGLNAYGSGATMRIGNSVVNGNATEVKQTHPIPPPKKYVASLAAGTACLS